MLSAQPAVLCPPPKQKSNNHRPIKIEPSSRKCLKCIESKTNKRNGLHLAPKLRSSSSKINGRSVASSSWPINSNISGPTTVQNSSSSSSPSVSKSDPYVQAFGPTISSPKDHLKLQPHEHTKLQHRSRLCLFLGYGIEHKGYRCWDPIFKRLRISRNVTF
ncbi:hypothetical protein OSB04_028638 [Centaurea solstitialis]|uniref:Retroviral polymerase SH3-like domain-containing protein n=1 Tax=Centaurea solstitialis TaxID=347529 RepID=A0AA38W0T8_9ASTR|nr:hypothetical protein OSB04_028638 [Centaurea solstitialis]